jgi:hypothetical protein
MGRGVLPFNFYTGCTYGTNASDVTCKTCMGIGIIEERK